MLIWRNLEPKLMATLLVRAAERYAAARRAREKEPGSGALTEPGK